MILKDHLNKKQKGIPLYYDDEEKIRKRHKKKITSINYKPFTKQNLDKFKEKVIEKSKTKKQVLNKTNSNFQFGRRKTTHIQIDSNKMAIRNNIKNKENIQINCYNFNIEDSLKSDSQKEIERPAKKNHSLDNKKKLKDKKENLLNENLSKINNFNTNENINKKEQNDLIKEEIEDENRSKLTDLIENEKQSKISKNSKKNSKINELFEKSKKKCSKPSSAKKFTPILKLNSDSKNSKKNNLNKSFSSSSYETSGIDIKGEILTKDQKTDFLNKMKKRLFNNQEKKNTHNKRLTLDLKRNMNDSTFLNLENNIIITERQEDIIEINSSVLSNAGTINNKLKTNQDSYSVIENIFSEKLYIYGVFDGHGENSNILSNFISNYIKKYFCDKKNYIKFYNNNIKNNKNNNLEKSETELAAESSNSSSITESDYSNSTIINTIINTETLKKIFQHNNQQFIKEALNSLDIATNELNFDLSYCGSTCVIIYIIKNILICSNIGDSRAVLFSCSNEDRWTNEPLSIDHKPDNPKEQKRILESGGEIHQHFENGVYEGPNRVYVKGKMYPGLSLTRSVGDSVGKDIGIIFEPDIIIKNIEITSKFLVIGSDGFWDMLMPYDVSRIVNPFFIKGDCEGACKALMKKAMKLWSKEDDDRDDITIIVVFIGKPNQKMIDTSKKDNKN